MKLFYTQTQAKEEISKLESKVTVLESDAEAREQESADLKEENKRLAEENATLKAENEAAGKAVEEAEARATKAESETAAANAKLATFDDEVEQRVIAKVASLGTGAVTVTGSSEGGDSKTRAEFSALDAKGRAEFLRNGGKLKD